MDGKENINKQEDEEQLIDNQQTEQQPQLQQQQQAQSELLGETPIVKQELIENEIQQIDQNENLLNFDKVLTDIGIGKYQILFYVILSTLGITEGAQITIFTLMIPILKAQWNVDDYLNSLSASLIFFGFLVGSLISGQISDRYGRKLPFIYSTLLTVTVITASAFSQNMYQLIILRGLMGLIVGFFGPLAMTLLTELTPQNVRGRFMSLITISINIGLLFGVILAYFILDSISAGNWRALMLWSVGPGLIAFIGALFFIDESPRYSMVIGNYELTFQIMDRICKMNGCKQLSDDEKKQLEAWGRKFITPSSDEDKASILHMFSGDLKIITPLIWANWFNLAFIYYGIIVLLPTFIAEIKKEQNLPPVENEKQNDFAKLAISSSSEMIAAGIAALLIDLKGFGRKNSLIMFYMLSAICCTFAYIDTLDRFVFWATLAKFFITMNFIFTYQYTAEIYNTKIRTTGIGMANGIGKVGGVIMPWICMMLITIELILPFLLFALQCIVVASLNFLLPYDTLGRELDS